MSFEDYEVGTRVEATVDFEIEEMLPSPGFDGKHKIQAGDTGEVARKQVVGNTQWLQVRWDRIKRTLNVDESTRENIRIVVS